MVDWSTATRRRVAEQDNAICRVKWVKENQTSVAAKSAGLGRPTSFLLHCCDNGGGSCWGGNGRKYGNHLHVH